MQEFAEEVPGPARLGRGKRLDRPESNGACLCLAKWVCQAQTAELWLRQTHPGANMIWQMSLLDHLRMNKEPNPSNKKPGTTLPGTVEKINKPTDPSLPEKAQIDVEGADDLYREIRIENTLTDENGNKVGLNEGAQVDVTIEADRADTTKKK